VKPTVAIIVLVALITASLALPVKDYIVSALGWVDGLGVWGPGFVVLFYIVACVLFLPGSVLTMGSGFLFGVPGGVVVVSIGSTLGAGLAFLVGRFVAREAIASKVASNAKFSAIDQAVGEHGFKIVLLTRLSPVFPFNMLNYAFGLTGVPFLKYIFASWLGMLPGTVMYVYLGATLGSLADVAAGRAEKTPAQWAFFGFGLAVTVIVTVLVTRIARRALRNALPRQGAP
jgi:uncharacterized membrane protein YdjX (TVP38/TMEM64 family)